MQREGRLRHWGAGGRRPGAASCRPCDQVWPPEWRGGAVCLRWRQPCDVLLGSSLRLPGHSRLWAAGVGVPTVLSACVGLLAPACPPCSQQQVPAVNRGTSQCQHRPARSRCRRRWLISQVSAEMCHSILAESIGRGRVPTSSGLPCSPSMLPETRVASKSPLWEHESCSVCLPLWL